MATLPGAIISPLRYRDSMWILTMGEPHVTLVDGAPTGPKGRLYGCEEVGKAKKVPYEAGRFLIEHCAYTGVVRVEEVERADGTGTDLLLDAAKEESLANFARGDEERWQRYLEYIVDRIERKLVIPPMPEPVKAVMKRRNYKLNMADFVTGVSGTAQPATPPQDDTVTQLMALVKAQAQQISDLTHRLNDVIGEPDEKKGKGGK